MRRQTSRDGPAQAGGEAAEDAGGVHVARAGRVDRLDRHALDGEGLLLVDEERALGA